MDDAGVWMRPEGRQLVIATGRDPETDPPPSDDAKEGSDAPAYGEHSTPPTRHRGDISGFSEAARRRLRDRLHSMRRDAPALFITLTYHEHLPTPDEAHADLDAMGKWILRRYPHASVTWKMEPQKRGWPHFHMIVTGVDYIPIQKLSKAWHRITDETSVQHLQSGVDVEPMVNQNGKLQSYLAKYLAKTYDGWPSIYGHRTDNIEAAYEWADHTGRWWGVIGRDAFPWADWDEDFFHLSGGEAQYLIRTLLDEWEAEIPDGVIPPTLTVNTRGDPASRLSDLVDRLP